VAKVHFPLVKYAINIDLQYSDKASVVTGHVAGTCGIPRNFVGGGSTNSVEDRKNRDMGGSSPLVRGSGGICNLVQEISFHIVKFS